MTTNSEFVNTRNLFEEYLNYDRDKPLSYVEWCNLPDDYKTAALFVQFYDQITLAWYKLKKSYSQECDGVEEVLQYLNKNVPRIEEDPRRFTPSYIYTVSWNCLDCVCWEGGVKSKIHKNEVSNIQNTQQSNMEESVFDLFDTVVQEFDPMLEAIKSRFNTKRFWEIIENDADDTIIVVAKILSERCGIDFYTGEGKKEFHARRFKSVTPDREEEVMELLRRIFSDVDDFYYTC